MSTILKLELSSHLNSTANHINSLPAKTRVKNVKSSRGKPTLCITLMSLVKTTYTLTSCHNIFLMPSHATQTIRIPMITATDNTEDQHEANCRLQV